MSSRRQVFLAFFMALLSCAIVLGSLSLSLLEGGYVLAEASGPDRQFVFNSNPILKMAGAEAAVEENIPLGLEELGQPSILSPTSVGCPHPDNWISIIIAPGDSLQSLAHRYDANVAVLKTNNCLSIDSLAENSILYVPNVPPRPTATRRPVIPWSYPTPYPTIPYWPVVTPWVPTSTAVTPPTLPPTLPPTWLPTLPPLPSPTDLPPTQPTATEETPTQPPPATEIPPTLAPPPILPTTEAPTQVSPPQVSPTQAPPPTQAAQPTQAPPPTQPLSTQAPQPTPAPLLPTQPPPPTLAPPPPLPPEAPTTPAASSPL
jgi:hypothetical protein